MMMAPPASGSQPSMRRETAPAPKETKSSGTEEVSVPTPATILVSLPADAQLTVDGTATQSTSTNRVFVSPVLEPGKDFYYTLKAEFVRNGKRVAASKEVTVRAGKETRVSFAAPVASLAQR
jgi:uncharacterized protein (TIGR03000 family)